MVLITKIQNLPQKNGTLLMMNQMVIIHTKIQLNFSQNQYNQALVIILMHIF